MCLFLYGKYIRVYMRVRVVLGKNIRKLLEFFRVYLTLSLFLLLEFFRVYLTVSLFF